MRKKFLNFSTILESRSQADWQDDAVLDIKQTEKGLKNLRECVLALYVVLQLNLRMIGV